MAFPIIALERFFSISAPFDRTTQMRRVSFLNGKQTASAELIFLWWKGGGGKDPQNTGNNKDTKALKQPRTFVDWTVGVPVNLPCLS
jgi:hypothetical protein